MPASWTLNLTDQPHLKRPFNAIAKSDPTPRESTPSGAAEVTNLDAHNNELSLPPFVTKRRQALDSRGENMPLAAGTRLYQDQIPSFMSVYDVDSESPQNREMEPASDSRFAASLEPLQSEAQRNELTHMQHKHNDSTSTQASESTDSSPTTTVSTTDSSTLTDPSPSSSPESPITILPLSSFAATTTTFGVQSLQDLRAAEGLQEPPKMLNNGRPLTSPSPRRPRNAKGLALKLPGSEAPQQSSEPSSPSTMPPAFIRPPPMKPRKKPSILSLQTSANPGLMVRRESETPPTPSLQSFGGDLRKTTLRHHQSSPQLLLSPDARLSGPAGGMQLPNFSRSKVNGLSTVFRKTTGLQQSNSMIAEPTIDEEESPIRPQMATRTSADIRGDEFDAPHTNEDVKSPGYPNGPIAMYDPNVYLYLEPTAEEAREFDVIINVADDVKNPFQAARDFGSKRASRDNRIFEPMDIDRDSIPEPDTAASTATFRTAFEFQPGRSPTTAGSSPTTPKATSARPDPEYIHVPWQHGSDISRDLLDLCETIEKRTKEGKKVLVHCLLGQSRSASLIIAYGIYLNPELTVNESYSAAKARSKWISPNMRLMYCLNDFRKLLHSKRQSPAGGFRGRTGRSPTKHRATLSADAIDLTLEQPHTAPLPTGRETSDRSSSPEGSPNRPRGSSSPCLGGVSPGPASAPPSSCAWGSDVQSGAPSQGGGFATWPSDDRKYSLSQPASSVAGPMSMLSVRSPQAESGGFFGQQQHEATDRQFEMGFPPTNRKDMSNTFGPPLQEDRSNQLQVPNLTGGRRSAPPEPLRSPRFPPENFGSIKEQFATINSAAGPPSPSLFSPRLQEMNGPSVHKSFAFHQTMHEDTPPTPNIMSPRAATFGTNPFGLAFAAAPTFTTAQDPISDFGFGYVHTSSSNMTPLRPTEDPRSPPTKGEAPIVRSIDDMM